MGRASATQPMEAVRKPQSAKPRVRRLPADAARKLVLGLRKTRNRLLADIVRFVPSEMSQPPRHFSGGLSRRGGLPSKITLDGYQASHRASQFELGKLRIKDKTAPEIWKAVLTA
jgi:hypothetical protein